MVGRILRRGLDASVSLPDPAYFDGPDGMPYFLLNPPTPNSAFAAESLVDLARQCIEPNAGAAFFANPHDPVGSSRLVLSMGILHSMLRHDSPEGESLDGESASSPRDMQGGLQILTASPLIALAALLALFHRPGRFKTALAIWLLAPVVVYVGTFAWQGLSAPLTPSYLSDALLGFSLISALLLIPWLILSALGALLGRLLRRVFFKSLPRAKPVALDS